jgi:hypothetical protein
MIARHFALLAVAAMPVVQAQSVVSAKAGMIHYTEGRVFVDDKATNPRLGQFPEIKRDSTLRTELGRAEVLLGPGIFLRTAENSSFRLVSSDLTDTRVELLTGSILVECAEIQQDESVRLSFKETTVVLKKNGLYRMNADPPEFLVHDGRAEVTRGETTLVVTRGRFVELDGQTLTAQKFDPKLGDTLYRWSSRRSNYVSMANLSSARSLRDGSSTFVRSSWVYNSYFGLFTFVPYGSRMIYSPFGWHYFSPRAAYSYYLNQIYAQRRAAAAANSMMSNGGGGPMFNPSLGYNTVGTRSYGNSAPAAPSAPAAAASAPAASPRASEAASPRGGDGGGRRN